MSSHAIGVFYYEQFHVDKLSSAHIYLRLNEGDTWDNIPQDLLTDLAQLTKANSIEGNKKDNVTIIYTPWSNLKKDGSMAVGQVSFKDQRRVKKILVPQRENAVINRLNKTKVEKQPDLQQEREDHRRELRKRDQAAQQNRVSFFYIFLNVFSSSYYLSHLIIYVYIPIQTSHVNNVDTQRKEEAKVQKERQEKKWQKDHAYDDLFTEENMEASNNQNRDETWEEDFM